MSCGVSGVLRGRKALDELPGILKATHALTRGDTREKVIAGRLEFIDPIS
jgi:hypothetical protein